MISSVDEEKINEKIIYLGKVVGTTYEPAKSNLKEFVHTLYKMSKSNIKPSDIEMKLIHEKDNQYDPNALRVMANLKGHGTWEVGYIPKTDNYKILEIGIDKFECKLVDLNEFDGKIVGLMVAVIKK